MLTSLKYTITLLFITIALKLMFPASAFSGEPGWLERHGAHIALRGGWGNYGMSDIGGTSYSENQTGHELVLNYAFGGASSGPGFYVEAGIDLSRRISLAAGSIYLRADHDFEIGSEFMDDYFNRVIYDTFTASMLAPFVQADFKFPAKGVEFRTSFGAAWLLGKAKFPFYVGVYEPPNLPHKENISFTASGLGAMGSLGLSFKLAKFVSFTTDLGYRYFNAGKLKDKNGNEWSLKLDFSGIYTSAGLQIGY